MAHTIRDIAQALGAEAEGDLDLIVLRASEPASAGMQDLALAMISCEVFSSVGPPNIMVPSARRETLRPLRPR